MSGSNNPLPPIGGISPVSGGKKPISRTIIIGGALVGVVVVVQVWSLLQSNSTSSKERKEEQSVVIGNAPPFKPVIEEQVPPKINNNPPPIENKPPPVNNNNNGGMLGNGLTRQQEAYLSGISPQDNQSTARPVVNGQQTSDGAPPQGEEKDEGELSKKLASSKYKKARAHRLKNPMFVITRGTQIPCTVDNPIDSTLSGLLVCHTPIDIQGATPGVKLLDAGTKITGEIRSGLIQGQRRLFVVWTTVETPPPDKVIIDDIDSPAADQLGRAGLEGDINTHFWERFGGAILLSFIDKGLETAAILASQAAQGNNRNNSGSTNFNNFQSQGSNVADSALRATIEIPPTLQRDQALPSIIFVARDWDFTDVWGAVVDR